MKSTILACALFAFTATCASAEEVRSLGSFQSWSAWSYKEKNKNKCYLYSEPLSKKPQALDHGRVGFSIRLLSGGSRTEAGLQAGYEFAPQAITAIVDGARFTMIPRGKSAWLRREEREGEFVSALRKGKAMKVEAVSKRGNKTVYQFSLKGIDAAMKRARKTCR